MKTILVPTDFSVNAYKALQYAVEISKRNQATIVLMHACQLLESPFVDRQALRAAYNRNLVEEIAGELKVWKSKVTEKAKGVKILTRIYKGSVQKSILQCAIEHVADLVIMGTQGASGLKEVVIGSTTASLISKSTIPVLAIPITYQWKTPANILFCTKGFETGAGPDAPLADIAALFSAQLHVAVFNEVDKVEIHEYLEHDTALTDYRKSFRKKYKLPVASAIQLEGDDFETTLQEYVSRLDIDMLAMVPHRHGFMDRLLHRSRTRQMAYHTKIPLLAIPG
ncbi:universal stress protein [Chitinophaga japonensis]|uniref:Nucleotide-binding universal stress UspA family protein n=1 Tax=Chitinophaga japonensis TaxID=104662 RepID=A0A562SYJ5_CHIJA|nr:universal stress protein [Chitinophaga japonensis]TWI86399.1 nucleotide-binding universal stress UspA family protein [Chitinophaga japonensis]